MTISWNDKLSTGIDWMDAQHKELLSRIDSFVDAIKDDRGAEVIGGLLKFIDAYVEVHFNDERKEMMRHDYPEKDEHLTEHVEFIDTFNAIKADIARDGVTPNILLKAKRGLLDWLINHICETDRRFSEFLKQRI